MIFFYETMQNFNLGKRALQKDHLKFTLQKFTQVNNNVPTYREWD